MSTVSPIDRQGFPRILTRGRRTTKEEYKKGQRE